MKKLKPYLLFLFACALATGVSVAHGNAAQGTDRGNGGDDYSQAFVDIGYELVESLTKEPLAGVDAKALLAAVEATKVHSAERLELRGYEVAAINYPEQAPPTIVVSREAWDRMEAAPHKRVFLAFHEYLGIMGIDDSNYQISARLDRAKVCDRTPAVREEIEQELKKSCYRIILDDLKYVDSLTLRRRGLKSLKKSDFAGLNGLEFLALEGNPILEVEDQFFPALNGLKKMRELFLPSSFPMGDCAFLAAMPELFHLAIGDTAGLNQQGEETFTPIQELPKSCFSQSTKMRKLSLAMDGKNFKENPFQGTSLKRLHIEGVNLEEIPAEVFSGITWNQGSALTLGSFDQWQDLAYRLKLESNTHLACFNQADRYHYQKRIICYR